MRIIIFTAQELLLNPLAYYIWLSSGLSHACSPSRFSKRPRPSSKQRNVTAPVRVVEFRSKFVCWCRMLANFFADLVIDHFWKETLLRSISTFKKYDIVILSNNNIHQKLCTSPSRITYLSVRNNWFNFHTFLKAQVLIIIHIYCWTSLKRGSWSFFPPS